MFVVDYYKVVPITSTHLTCVPFLSVVVVNLKFVVSPELLVLTRAEVN